MPVRLTLICCGATAATEAAAFPLDESLAPGAAAAALALAGRLNPETRAVVSPALRATATASALGLAAAIDPELRDWDLGGWAGRRLADVAAENPESVASWMADPAAAPHGGEPLERLLDRTARWLDGRIGETGRLVAVTHPAVIRAGLLHVLAAPARSFWSIDVEPLGVTRLTSNGERWSLRQGAWS